MKSAHRKVVLAVFLLGCLVELGHMGMKHQDKSDSAKANSTASFEKEQLVVENGAPASAIAKKRPAASRSRILDARLLQGATFLTVATTVDVEVFKSEHPVFEIVGESQAFIDSIKADVAEGNLILSHELSSPLNLKCGSTPVSTVSTGRSLVINVRTESKALPCALVRIGVSQVPDIMVKSSGDVKVMGVAQERLALNIYGAGDISADGKVKELSIQIHGSGDVNTTKMSADKVSILSQGSGDVTVMASGRLQSKLQSSGDITAMGRPNSPQG